MIPSLWHDDKGVDPHQPSSGFEITWAANIRCESKPGKEKDQPPPRIELTRFNPETGGAGKSMMIPVPALAEGDQADLRDVVALDGNPLHSPPLVSSSVRDVPDEPVTRQ